LQQIALYSITSSARASSEGDMLSPKRLRGLEIDDQLEFRWLLNWKTAGFTASQDTIDV
jgi:hypothetical protein